MICSNHLHCCRNRHRRLQALRGETARRRHLAQPNYVRRHTLASKSSQSPIHRSQRLLFAELSPTRMRPLHDDEHSVILYIYSVILYMQSVMLYVHDEHSVIFLSCAWWAARRLQAGVTPDQGKTFNLNVIPASARDGIIPTKHYHSHRR